MEWSRYKASLRPVPKKGESESYARPETLASVSEIKQGTFLHLPKTSRTWEVVALEFLGKEKTPQLEDRVV